MSTGCGCTMRGDKDGHHRSSETTATRYSSRYTEQKNNQQDECKLLKNLVNRGGLEPSTR
jgi:hypothetical protein